MRKLNWTHLIQYQILTAALLRSTYARDIIINKEAMIGATTPRRRPAAATFSSIPSPEFLMHKWY